MCVVSGRRSYSSVARLRSEPMGELRLEVGAQGDDQAEGVGLLFNRCGQESQEAFPLGVVTAEGGQLLELVNGQHQPLAGMGFDPAGDDLRQGVVASDQTTEAFGSAQQRSNACTGLVGGPHGGGRGRLRS
ncbi:MAG: hypothetical protein IPM84_19590 [Anaerolineae bacterium]|nr:hypothetical protein [Anaerolineae bacterium]